MRTDDPTYPRPAEPLVERNAFRNRPAASQAIVSFAQARLLLPQPLLPEQPDWVEMYWRAWEMAWSHLHRPAPGSGLISSYIDSAAGDHIFMWDSAFMMNYGLYGRRAFNFMGTLDNFYARQHPDGFICREIDIRHGHDLYHPFDPDSTGPAVMALAEWNYFRCTGDDSRLEQVFWPLLAYHRWLRAHRTWPSQLYWATGLSSGMSNQERVPGGRHHHQHWTWVDANMQACLDCLVLGQMAQLLGEQELSLELAGERTFLLREINARLWNEETNFYHDLSPEGQFSPVRSIAAYWALLDKDLVPAGRMENFLRPLRDVDAFNRPHRIPSQAADSPGYDGDTGGCWQGGVWASTNYVALRGLRTAGQHRLAHEVAKNHLQNVYEVFRRTDSFWENYAPERPAPGEPARRDFVGWTGLTPIAVLLENIIGLTVDWPQRRVVWDRRLDTTGQYGVLNYPLGRTGLLEIVGDQDAIAVTTTTGFNLTVVDDVGSLQTAVTAGTTEIKL